MILITCRSGWLFCFQGYLEPTDCCCSQRVPKWPKWSPISVARPLPPRCLQLWSHRQGRSRHLQAFLRLGSLETSKAWHLCEGKLGEEPQMFFFPSTHPDRKKERGAYIALSVSYIYVQFRDCNSSWTLDLDRQVTPQYEDSPWQMRFMKCSLQHITKLLRALDRDRKRNSWIT